MKHFTYLFIDFGAVLIPFLFSFHPKLRFNREWKYFFPALAVGSGIFLIWDIIYTAIGVWHFNSEYLCGISFLGLPLEEILFLSVFLTPVSSPIIVLKYFSMTDGMATGKSHFHLFFLCCY